MTVLSVRCVLATEEDCENWEVICFSRFLLEIGLTDCRHHFENHVFFRSIFAVGICFRLSIHYFHLIFIKRPHIRT